MFKSLSLRTKLLLIGAVQLLCVCVTMFVINAKQRATNAREQSLEKARTIVLNVEAVREEMEQKWRLGQYNQGLLAEWSRGGETEKILHSVPVFTAWNSALKKSKEGGYEFRVPKFQPRNPQNEPDEFEARVLKKLENSGLKEHAEYDPSKNALRYFRPIVLERNCLLCHGDPKTSLALWGNDRGLDATGHPMENWKEGEVHGAFEVIQHLDKSDALVRADLLWNGLIIGALALAGGVVFYVLVNRSIIRPLRETVDVFARFSGGDLRQRLTVASEDEIGLLRASVNRFSDSLRTVLASMQSSAGRLTGSSRSLNTTSESLTKNADDSKRQSATVSSAAEEMSINMKNMAASGEEMSHGMRAVATAVKEMTATVGEIAKNAENSAKIAGDAARLAAVSNDKISQLGTAADEIGKVIEVIQDIAEQTNLLALNATIEAARAGEAGKGFAVVATEVKELAKQSAAATDDIRSRITAIQQSTQEAVTAISEISEIINSVNRSSTTIATAVEEQSIMTQQMAKNVSQIAVASESVARGVNETAVASQEINVSIGRMDQVLVQTSVAANDSKVAGDELAAIASGMETLTKRFQFTTETPSQSLAS